MTISSSASQRVYKKTGMVYPHKEGCRCFRCSKVAWNKGVSWSQTHKEKISKTLSGRHLSPKTEIKKGQRLSSQTEFKKGNVSWSRLYSNLMPHGKEHHNWKGDDVGYIALHKWVESKLGRPDLCSACGESKRITWANKSGKYMRNIGDWIPLCYKCHFAYDKHYLRSRDYHGRFI